MAKFTSNYEVDGSTRNQTYYARGGKSYLKKQSRINRDRILTDPNFVRTRENGSEFGIAARAGKLLRYAFATLVKDAADTFLTSRLTQMMTRIKNEDTTSVRGERNVAIGIATAAGTALLIDFNFNKNAILKSVLSKPYALDTATGVITIPGLIPKVNVTIPDGATHITFTGAMGIVDFEAGIYGVDYTNAVNLPYDNTATDVTLTPTAVPAGTGATFYLLHIAFFQQVNSIQYPLNNGGFNALAIIHVQS